MQQQSLPSRQHRVSLRFDTAYRKFRGFREDLSTRFRGPQNSSIDINPSIFTNNQQQRTRQLDPILPEGSTPAAPGIVMDGTTDRALGRAPKPAAANIAAIFVHAGAGYHSTTNEHIHLGACNDAARMAMRILKAGGTAVDAVEAAIKVLEDKEITNAGYGSNLAIDGVVECDATLVDYLGRSGACGATPQIKNPIHLARTILEMSNKPLSLRRVPPNLLVGQGATDFAWEHGLAVCPHDAIVSKNARDRWLRWREDLRRAEGDRLTPSSSQGGEEEIDLEYEGRVQEKQRRDHTNAILTGTWNEGQPDSPQAASPQPSPVTCPQDSPRCPSTRRSPSPSAQYGGQNYLVAGSPGRSNNRSPSGSPVSKRTRHAHMNEGSGRTHSLLVPGSIHQETHKSAADVGITCAPTLDKVRPRSSDGHMSPIENMESERNSLSMSLVQEGTVDSPFKQFAAEDDDMITDTVGAIAIDVFGHIAAGSSSGGIGMKHRGRVGPAALVGVGTAVIPADDHDQEHVSVAAVTSGTGEHMATTMASQKCAERLYHNTRRARGGADIEATEEEAMESFVQADFMGHPGVCGSNSAGAIGVMAVKKTPYGYFLHFAHNTDSFALASMHSNEKDAKCVMSRIGDHGNVVQGGRKIRLE